MSDTDGPAGPSYPQAQSAGAPEDEMPAQPPYDPERGLRGVMSAMLVFEAITILLGLTVLANGGRSAPAWELITVAGLGLAHMLTPALIRRRHAIAVIFVLQAALIACWLIHAAIGAMGVIFTLVWIGMVYLRREFRRRMANGAAAGTMAGAPDVSGGAGYPGDTGQLPDDEETTQ